MCVSSVQVHEPVEDCGVGTKGDRRRWRLLTASVRRRTLHGTQRYREKLMSGNWLYGGLGGLSAGRKFGASESSGASDVM